MRDDLNKNLPAAAAVWNRKLYLRRHYTRISTVIEHNVFFSKNFFWKLLKLQLLLRQCCSMIATSFFLFQNSNQQQVVLWSVTIARFLSYYDGPPGVHLVRGFSIGVVQVVHMMLLRKP